MEKKVIEKNLGKKGFETLTHIIKVHNNNIFRPHAKPEHSCKEYTKEFAPNLNFEIGIKQCGPQEAILLGFFIEGIVDVITHYPEVFPNNTFELTWDLGRILRYFKVIYVKGKGVNFTCFEVDKKTYSLRKIDDVNLLDLEYIHFNTIHIAKIKTDPIYIVDYFWYEN